MPAHLVLRGNFLLENTNENTEFGEHFFIYRSLYNVQKGTNTRALLSGHGGVRLESQCSGSRGRKVTV